MSLVATLTLCPTAPLASIPHFLFESCISPPQCSLDPTAFSFVFASLHRLDVFYELSEPNRRRNTDTQVRMFDHLIPWCGYKAIFGFLRDIIFLIMDPPFLHLSSRVPGSIKVITLCGDQSIRTPKTLKRVFAAAQDHSNSSTIDMKITLSTLALLASASAHTIFQELWVNGVAQGHTKGIRVPVRQAKPLYSRNLLNHF